MSNNSKMPHEETAEKFNIDMENVQMDNAKPIPPEWIHEIIQNAISNCQTQPNYQNVNQKDKIITLSFQTEDEVVNFEQELGSKIFKCINSYLREKGENPKDFNRGIVTSTQQNGKQLDILY